MKHVPAGLAVLAAATLATAQPPATAPAGPPAYHLAGFAELPADTFAPGPRSGQFIGAGPFNGRTPPFDGQPVQGFSSVIQGDAPGEYLALSDNGFGGKANSADYLLRVYRVRPDFKMAGGGTGEVAWEVAFTLSDPEKKIPWPIVADGQTYPNSDIPVPAEVREERLLTGGDFDVESFVRLPDGTYWIGDEFGPFLLHVDAQGRVLQAPVELPGDGMWSPDHPTKPAGQTRIGRSKGLEGMAIVRGDRDVIAAVLEAPPEGTNEVPSFQYAPGPIGFVPVFRPGLYSLPAPAAAIGGIEFLGRGVLVVIERDGLQGEQAQWKRLARAVFTGEAGNRRDELVDLLAILDPHDLDGDGQDTFRFPYLTIESVCLVDDRTLLVANDNNYPFTNGRGGQDPDSTQFILIRFDTPLADDSAAE